MATVVTVTVNPTFDTTATADHVEPNSKVRCTDVWFDPGGGGINVARAIRLLGGEAVAVWARGDMFGESIRRHLDEESMEHVPVEIAGANRQSFAVIEESSSRHWRFSTPGPALQPAELDRMAAAVDRLAPDLLVLSGGLSPGVPADYYARLTATAAARGARVILDTHDAPLRAALDAGGVYLVKPNFRELCRAAELESNAEEPDVVAAARRMVATSESTAVLVSLGAAGAILVTAEQVQRVMAPAVPIRSRIGAGDSMVAGVALRLAEGADLVDAVRFGVAAGTAAVMTPGTELCRRADAERLYELSIAGGVVGHCATPVSPRGGCIVDCDPTPVWVLESRETFRSKTQPRRNSRWRPLYDRRPTSRSTAITLI